MCSCVLWAMLPESNKMMMMMIMMLPLQLTKILPTLHICQPSAKITRNIAKNCTLRKRHYTPQNYNNYCLASVTAQLGLPRVPGYPSGTRVIDYPGNFLLPGYPHRLFNLIIF